jgi:dihydrofolate reductase
MTVRLIWAQSRDGVIGRDGALPWRIPEDMRRFRELTTGGTVIMGRRTWESLPSRFRPLPDRRNVVVSRDPSYDAPGAQVVTSLDEAFQAAGDAWVAGGAEIYAAALPRADALLVTDVDVDVDGDAHAPPVGPEWAQVVTGEWQTSDSGLRYRFRELTRQAGVPPGSR